MTDVNKDLPCAMCGGSRIVYGPMAGERATAPCPACTKPTGTVAELRALLEKATPGPWKDAPGSRSAAVYSKAVDAAIYINVDRESVGVIAETVDRWKADAALIAALRNAAPDLLRVVEAVANFENPVDDEERCLFCGRRSSHEEDCDWTLARMLTSGAT